MNWRVNAGPAAALPALRATGPTMNGLRTPIRASVLLVVAAPMSWSADTHSFGGRGISGVSVMGCLACATLRIFAAVQPYADDRSGGKSRFGYSLFEPRGARVLVSTGDLFVEL